MARPAVVDIDHGFDKIITDLIKAEKRTLLVGIQEGSKTPGMVKAGRKQKAGLNIAQYAAQNEFGTREIPERSFMRTAFDENIQLISSFLTKEIGLVIDQKKTLDQALKLTGQLITGLIQKKIRQIVFPPNSPRTIAEKGSSKPLIDFGSMIQAVRYTIRKG